MTETTGGYIIPGKGFSDEEIYRIKKAIQDYFSGASRMTETTATHDVEFEVTSWEDGYAGMVARAVAIKTDAIMMKRELTEQEEEFIKMVDALEHEEAEIPIGWLCPRCGAVNAPDVKRCDCEPKVDDQRHGALPNTVAGPSETK